MAGKKEQKKKRSEQGKKLSVLLGDLMPSKLKQQAELAKIVGSIDSAIEVVDSFSASIDKIVKSRKVTKSAKVNLKNLYYALNNLKGFYEKRKQELSVTDQKLIDQALIDRTKNTLSGFYFLSVAIHTLLNAIEVSPLREMDARVEALLPNIGNALKVASENAVLLDVYVDTGNTILLDINTPPLLSDSMRAVVPTKTPLAYAPSIIMSQLINPIIYGTKDILASKRQSLGRFNSVKYIEDKKQGVSYLVIDTKQPQSKASTEEKLKIGAKYIRAMFLQTLPLLEANIRQVTGESINLGDYVTTEAGREIYTNFKNIVYRPTSIKVVDDDEMSKAYNIFENTLKLFRTSKDEVDLSNYRDLTDVLIDDIRNGYNTLDTILEICTDVQGFYINLTKLRERAIASYNNILIKEVDTEGKIVEYVLREMQNKGLQFELSDKLSLVKFGHPSGNIFHDYYRFSQYIGKRTEDEKFLSEVVQLDSSGEEYFVPLFSSKELGSVNKNLAFMSFLSLLKYVQGVHSYNVSYISNTGDIIRIAGVRTNSKDIADSILTLATTFKSMEEIPMTDGHTLRVVKGAALDKKADSGASDYYYYFDLIPETGGMMNLINRFLGSKKLTNEIVYDDVLRAQEKSPFSFDMSYFLGGKVPLEPVAREVIEAIIKKGYSPIVATFITNTTAIDRSRLRMWSDYGVILGYPVILGVVENGKVTNEILKELFSQYVSPIIKEYGIQTSDPKITTTDFLESVLNDYAAREVLSSMAAPLLKIKDDEELRNQLYNLKEKYSERKSRYIADIVLTAFNRAFLAVENLAYALTGPSKAASDIRRNLSFNISKFSKDYLDKKISNYAYLIVLKALFQYLFSDLVIEGTHFRNGLGVALGLTSILDIIGGIGGFDAIFDAVCRVKLPRLKPTEGVSEYTMSYPEGTIEGMLSIEVEDEVETGESGDWMEIEKDESRMEIEEEEEDEEEEEEDEEEEEEEEEISGDYRELVLRRVRKLLQTVFKPKPMLVVDEGYEEMTLKGVKNIAKYWGDGIQLSHTTLEGNTYYADGVKLMVLDYSDIPTINSNIAKPLFMLSEEESKVEGVRSVKSVLKEIVPDYKERAEQKSLEERIGKSRAVDAGPGKSFFTVILATDPSYSSDSQDFIAPMAVIVLGEEILGPFMVNPGTTKEDMRKNILHILGEESIASISKRDKDRVKVWYEGKTGEALTSYLKAKIKGLLEANPWLGSIAPAHQNYVIVGGYTLPSDESVTVLPYNEAVDVLFDDFKKWLKESGINLYRVLEQYIGYIFGASNVSEADNESERRSSILDNLGLTKLFGEVEFRRSILAKLNEAATRLTVLARDLNNTMDRLLWRWIEGRFPVPSYWDALQTITSAYYRMPSVTVSDFLDVESRLNKLKEDLETFSEGLSGVRSIMESALKEYASNDELEQIEDTILLLTRTNSVVKSLLEQTIPEAVRTVSKASEIVVDISLVLSAFASASLSSSFTLGIESLRNTYYSSFPLSVFDKDTLRSCITTIRGLFFDLNHEMEIINSAIRELTDVHELEIIKEKAQSRGHPDIFELANGLETLLAIDSITKLPVVIETVQSPNQSPTITHFIPLNPTGGFGTQPEVRAKNILGSDENLKIPSTIELTPLVYSCSVCKRQYTIDRLPVLDEQGMAPILANRDRELYHIISSSLYDYLFERVPDLRNYEIDYSGLQIENDTLKGSVALKRLPHPVLVNKERIKYLIKEKILEPLQNSKLDRALEEIAQRLLWLYVEDPDGFTDLLMVYSSLCTLAKKTSVTAVCPYCGAKGVTGEVFVKAKRDEPFVVEVIVQDAYVRYDPSLRTSVLDILMDVKYEDPFSPTKVPVLRRTSVKFLLGETDPENFKNFVLTKIENYVKNTFVPQIICGHKENILDEDDIANILSQLFPGYKSTQRLIPLGKGHVFIPPESVEVRFDRTLSLLFASDDEVVEAFHRYAQPEIIEIGSDELTTMEYKPYVLYDIHVRGIDWQKKEIKCVIFKRVRQGGSAENPVYVLYDISKVFTIPYSSDPHTFTKSLFEKAIREEIENDAATIFGQVPSFVFEINIQPLRNFVDKSVLEQGLKSVLSDEVSVEIIDGYLRHPSYKSVEQFYTFYTKNIFPAIFEDMSKQLENMLRDVVRSDNPIVLTNQAVMHASEYVAGTVISFTKEQIYNEALDRTMAGLLEELSEDNNFRVAFVSNLTKSLVVDHIIKYLKDNQIIDPQKFDERKFSLIVKSAVSAHINKYINLAWNPRAAKDPNLTFGAFLKKVDVTSFLNGLFEALRNSESTDFTGYVPVETRVKDFDVVIKVRDAKNANIDESKYITISVFSEDQNKVDVVKIFKIWQYWEGPTDIVIVDRRLAMKHFNSLRNIFAAYAARKALHIIRGYEQIRKAQVNVEGIGIDLQLPNTVDIILNSKDMEQYLASNNVQLNDSDPNAVKNLAGAILCSYYDRNSRKTVLDPRSFTQSSIEFEIRINFASPNLVRLKGNDIKQWLGESDRADNIIQNVINAGAYELTLNCNYSWKLTDSLTSGENNLQVKFPLIIIPRTDVYTILEIYMTIAALQAVDKSINELMKIINSDNNSSSDKLLDDSKPSNRLLRDFLFLVKIYSPITRLKNYWIKLRNSESSLRSEDDIVFRVWDAVRENIQFSEVVKEVYAMYGRDIAVTVDSRIGELVGFDRVLDISEADFSSIMAELERLITEAGLPSEEQIGRSEGPEVRQPEVVPQQMYRGIKKQDGGLAKVEYAQKPSSVDTIKVIEWDSGNGNIKLSFNNSEPIQMPVGIFIDGFVNPDSVTDQNISDFISEIKRSPNNIVLIESDDRSITSTLRDTLTNITIGILQKTVESLYRSRTNLLVRMFGALLKGKYEQILLKIEA